MAFQAFWGWGDGKMAGISVEYESKGFTEMERSRFTIT